VNIFENRISNRAGLTSTKFPAESMRPSIPFMMTMGVTFELWIGPTTSSSLCSDRGGLRRRLERYLRKCIIRGPGSFTWTK
jgi:hypothetical protein